MPLTFPAHQLPVLPLKLWRPEWFDATALCIGAAAPDVAQAFGGWVTDQSHTAIGIVVWAVPFTLVASTILRWRGAAGLFAQLPDLGWLRVRSYGALGNRRPRVVLTVTGALIGAVSHVVIDSFTHVGRWGANLAHLNGVIAPLPIRGDLTGARLLQLLGHTVGSAAALYVFAVIGRRQLMEAWYGRRAVESARNAQVSVRRRVLFWAIALVTMVVAFAVVSLSGDDPIFAVIFAVGLGLLVAGCVCAPD